MLSFIAWGAGTLTLSKESSSAYVGSVGSEKITHKEFSTVFRYYDLLARTQAAEEDKTQGEKEEKKSGEQTPKPNVPSFDELKGLTWQTIVLSREARREGITVSDEDVRNEVMRIFSTNGNFDQALYDQWIRNIFQGRARDFEEVIRKHVASQKLNEKILKGVPETERETHWQKWFQALASRTKIQDYMAQGKQ